jgi:DNA modification methylase
VSWEVRFGDCRDYIDTLASADIIVTDPPYGIGYEVRERKMADRGRGLRATKVTATAARPMVAGDDEPFDPVPWLSSRVAFFGANYYAHLLPPGGSWVVWDKRRDSAPDDHSDCELIWLSVPGALRIHRQKWRGIVREGEENCSRSRKLHPNQKPVALLAFLLTRLRAKPGEVVADPYAGSGSTGVAALRAGCRFVGCEISPEHHATAVARLSAEFGGAERTA